MTHLTRLLISLLALCSPVAKGACIEPNLEEAISASSHVAVVIVRSAELAVPTDQLKHRERFRIEYGVEATEWLKGDEVTLPKLFSTKRYRDPSHRYFKASEEVSIAPGSTVIVYFDEGNPELLIELCSPSRVVSAKDRLLVRTRQILNK